MHYYWATSIPHKRKTFGHDLLLFSLSSRRSSQFSPDYLVPGLLHPLKCDTDTKRAKRLLGSEPPKVLFTRKSYRTYSLPFSPSVKHSQFDNEYNNEKPVGWFELAYLKIFTADLLACTYTIKFTKQYYCVFKAPYTRPWDVLLDTRQMSHVCLVILTVSAVKCRKRIL